MDNTQLSELRVTACGLLNGLNEQINYTQSLATVVQSSRNASCASWRLQASQDASLAAYSSLIGSFVYRNIQDEPSPGVRDISFVVVDIGNGTSGTVAASQPAVAFVSVRPQNDNTPMFGQSVYRTAVLENSTTTLNITLSATDLDQFGDDNLTFSILPSVYSSHFSLSGESTGLQVNIVRQLDSDSTPRLSTVQFSVAVSDNSMMPVARSSMTTVEVQIVDVNDNIPQFVPASDYSESVDETTSINTTVLTVRAVDNDGGENGRISYALMQQDAADLSGSGPVESPSAVPFRIDHTSGAIYLAQSLDFEDTTNFTFLVVAQDSGNPPNSATATVRIRVINNNDHAPQFGQAVYSISVSENTAVGSIILDVVATDQDSGAFGQVSYSTNTTAFSMATNGSLTVAAQQDFEALSSPEIHALVTATDGGNPARQAEALVLVTVVNLNDESPVFSQAEYNMTIPEDHPNGSRVLQVFASDADNLMSLQYSIHSTDLFAINSRSGEVILAEMTADVLDYETRQQHTAIVQVSDGRHMISARLVINISDVNDNRPQFILDPLISLSVLENSEAATVVANLSATDADSGLNAQLTYSIIGTLPFSIDSSGLLTVRLPLDREQQAQYTVTVLAEDQGTPSLNSSASFVVNILDQNDVRPTITLASGADTVTYYEGNGSLPIVSTLTLSDNDTSGLASLSVQLLLPRCQLSSAALQAACSGSAMQSLCVQNCAEMVELPGISLTANNGSYLLVLSPGSGPTSSNILRSLTYTALAEDPYPGVRTVIITASDGSNSPAVQTISIQLLVVNEHRPNISSVVTSFAFTENQNILEIGRLAQISVEDRDSNSDGIIRSATINLVNPQDGGMEGLLINPGNGAISSSIEGSTITLVGNGPPADYAAVLSTLNYTNTRDEPSLVQRIVQITLADRNLTSRALTLTIDIVPVDDSPPQLVSSSLNFTYVEGSGSILLSSLIGLNITDADEFNSAAQFGADILFVTTTSSLAVNDQELNFTSRPASGLSLQSQQGKNYSSETLWQACISTTHLILCASPLVCLFLS